MLRSRALALLLVPMSAVAQPDIVDHQDALAVVPARSVQADIASSYAWDQPNLFDAGLLVHWGLGAGWEARIGAPPHIRTIPTPHNHMSGFGDPTVGAKVELGEALGWTFAATSDASVPIGGSQGRPHAETLTTVTAGRDLPASFALEAVGELAVDTGAPAPTGAFVLVLSRRVLRHLDVSVDVTTGIEDLEVASVVIQNGYALLLSPALQLNAVVGIGVEGSSAPDALVGVGLSVRR